MFVDGQGKTTLNPEQYLVYRQEKAVEAENKKKKAAQPGAMIL